MQSNPLSQRVSVIDSHTAGEPTRLVYAGGPELGKGSLSERLAFMREFHDCFRSAVVNEPRGSDVIVGALLCEPIDTACAAGVIFFNNVGYLGMCGHGTIGLIVSLAHLGRIGPGDHKIETAVGVVCATLHTDGRVTVENVASYRMAANVLIVVPGYGTVRGDIAWGGNWFYLVEEHPMPLLPSNVDSLTEFAWAIRKTLAGSGISGLNGAEIDHIELFAPSPEEGVDCRNFVLCPGKAYDRSPCGTGTSAKLACLHASGKLSPGDRWRQEGILGTVFEGSIRLDGDRVIPSITGSAYVTSEATLIMNPDDPFRAGIQP
jgi:4-hydroxyproline epimerase